MGAIPRVNWQTFFSIPPMCAWPNVEDLARKQPVYTFMCICCNLEPAPYTLRASFTHDVEGNSNDPCSVRNIHGKYLP